MRDGDDATGGMGALRSRGRDSEAGARSPDRAERSAQEPLSPAARQQEAAASLTALLAGPGASRRRAADEDGEPVAKRGAPRSRLTWSVELHGRFLAAVQHLGVNTAVPKTILQLMNVDGMTRENVASHLQKYRLALRKAAGIPADQPLPEDAIARYGAVAPVPTEADPAQPAAAAAAAAAPPPHAPPHPSQAAVPSAAAPARPGAAGQQMPPPAPVRRTSNHGLTSQELSSIATSASFASMFAPGAGTRPPPPGVLKDFIMGHADSFAAADKAEPQRGSNANNPPKPECEKAADARS